MQVVSGVIYNPVLHFEALPSSEMQHEMTTFITLLFETGPNGLKPVPPLTLLALSQTIQRNRQAYYDALEQNNKTIEITAWLDYFCKIVIEAQTQSQRMIDFLIEKTKLYDQVGGRVNERQRRAMNGNTERLITYSVKALTALRAD
jgi:hypothetical protein